MPMRSAPLLLAATFASCTRISAQAPVAEPAAPALASTTSTAAEAPAAADGVFELRYAASQESSCSQSYDFSQWSGRAALEVRGPTARLEMITASSSTGGGWQDPADRYHYAEAARRCTYTGKVESHRGTVTIAFELAHADASSYECDSNLAGFDDIGPWTLSCWPSRREFPVGAKPTQQVEQVDVLSCRQTGKVPWLWSLLYGEKETLNFGAGRPVHIAAEDPDSVMGALAGVPFDAGPRQWVERPESSP